MLAINSTLPEDVASKLASPIEVSLVRAQLVVSKAREFGVQILAMQNIVSRLKQQKEILVNSILMMQRDSEEGEHADVTNAEAVRVQTALKGDACLKDADMLAEKLTDFVLAVLDNAAEIHGMLVHLKEGMFAFKMLKKEAWKADPNNARLQKYAIMAYANLDKANEMALQLSKDAQAAARLTEYVSVWKKKEDTKLLTKTTETQELLEEAVATAEQKQKASKGLQDLKDFGVHGQPGAPLGWSHATPEMICEMIQNVTEKQMNDLMKEIDDTQEMNEKLRKNAMDAYEGY